MARMTQRRAAVQKAERHAARQKRWGLPPEDRAVAGGYTTDTGLELSRCPCTLRLNMPRVAGADRSKVLGRRRLLRLRGFECCSGRQG